MKHRSSAARSSTPPKGPLLMIAGGLILLLALGYVFFGSSLTSTPPAVIEVTGAPALKVNQEKIDFGNVKLGETVQAEFTLTNVGDQPLKFTSKPYIQVAAGC